jgi:hypothetical protein
MERGSQHAPLPNRYDPTCGGAGIRHTGHARQHLDTRSNLLHPRSPDEHRPDGTTGYPGNIEVSLEGCQLPAERVTAHHRIQYRQLPLISTTIQDFPAQQDHPGTRSVGRHAPGKPGLQGLHQVEGDQQPADRGGLATRHDEGVHPSELLAAANQRAAHPALGQRPLVLPRITLQGKHPDNRLPLRHSKL